MKKIIIQDRIFELFPEFYRGVIIVRAIQNQKSNKRIRKLLRKAIAERMDVDLATDTRIQAWNEAHRKFGSSPEEYLPSIASLLQRMDPQHSLPFINSVVALFNYISIKYVLPCGGDDVQSIEGNLVLGTADGSEHFLPLGGKEEQTPFPGEVIYYDDATKNVMCRRWNWRNGEHTKILPESQQIVINIDCLPPVTPEIGNQARDEMAELLGEHCNADLDVSALHEGNRVIELTTLA